jgi:hypothetical protein
VVQPSQFRLVHVKRKPWLLRFRLISEGGVRYELFVRTDKEDPPFLALLERTLLERSIRG